jgi:hypothetical protein
VGLFVGGVLVVLAVIGETLEKREDFGRSGHRAAILGRGASGIHRLTGIWKIGRDSGNNSETLHIYTLAACSAVMFFGNSGKMGDCG